jgi:integrase/recombinase XerD
MTAETAPGANDQTPVSTRGEEMLSHRLTGRDQPVRERRREFRRCVPRRLPARLDPRLIESLIAAAVSWRDKAILTLLCRTGQRIGDWSDVNGRHGILGMTLSDVDEREQTITVRLKGARQDHRVPVTDDFWPLFRRYLKTERRTLARTSAAWVAQRRGHGMPLSYGAFESALRLLGRKVGATVRAHQFPRAALLLPDHTADADEARTTRRRITRRTRPSLR